MRYYWFLFLLCHVCAERPQPPAGELSLASDDKELHRNVHLSFQKHNAFTVSPSLVSSAQAQEAPLALLVAVSGRGSTGSEKIEDADFFQTLLPSFLNTTSAGDGFDYSFYLAFDVGDPFYDSAERRADFERLFLQRVGLRPFSQSILGTLFGSNALRRRAKLHWVSVAPYADGQTGPVRAWNTAFQEAFSDGASYFYQLGEDVQLLTSGWAKELVGQLQKQGDVGIAGGQEINYQVDSQLMPCVMVPRAHMSIFGTFFPTKLHNWWSDDWILGAYKPFRLAARVPTVTIANTHATSRYAVSEGDNAVSQKLEESSQKAISKYLQLLGSAAHLPQESISVTPSGEKQNAEVHTMRPNGAAGVVNKTGTGAAAWSKDPLRDPKITRLIVVALLMNIVFFVVAGCALQRLKPKSQK